MCNRHLTPSLQNKGTKHREIMKTAEEIFQSRYRAGADGWMDQKSVLECMREYGTQCAEQALKDAEEQLSVWEFKDEDIYYSAIESIRSTPIQTP